MLPQKTESSVKPLLPISAKRRKLFIKWVLKFSAKRRANCAALCRHHKYKKQYLSQSVKLFCLEFFPFGVRCACDISAETLNFTNLLQIMKNLWIIICYTMCAGLRRGKTFRSASFAAFLSFSCAPQGFQQLTPSTTFSYGTGRAKSAAGIGFYRVKRSWRQGF